MGSIASMQLEETSTNDHRKYITISDYNKTARRPSSHPGPLVAIETAWQRVQNAHSLTHSHGRLMVEQGGGTEWLTSRWTLCNISSHQTSPLVG